MLNRTCGSVSVKAPAKINIHLEIAGKRADGYHDIVSIFQMVSLYDELAVTCIDGLRKIALYGFGGIPPAENLVHKAAALFQHATGIRGEIHVHATKNIPPGAGLAGGSSNAAAILRALNRIYSGPLSADDLRELGMKLGSDVGFFLVGPTALVTGRGEYISPIATRQDVKYLVIVPDFRVNTTSAYERYDTEIHEKPEYRIRKEDLIDIYTTQSVDKWSFSNSFLPLVLQNHPETHTLMETLKQRGAAFAGLSGSGSAFFAVFPRERETREISQLIRKTYPTVFTVTSLTRLPVISPID